MLGLVQLAWAVIPLGVMLTQKPAQLECAQSAHQTAVSLTAQTRTPADTHVWWQLAVAVETVLLLVLGWQVGRLWRKLNAKSRSGTAVDATQEFTEENQSGPKQTGSYFADLQFLLGGHDRDEAMNNKDVHIRAKRAKTSHKEMA